MAYNQFSRGTGNRGGQYSGGSSGQRGGMQQAKTEKKVFKPLTEENYVELAEEVILKIRSAEKADENGKKQVQELTTSKIRNLLAMSMDIYNDVLERKEEKLDRDLLGRINYLKVRMVYEAGREKAVKRFVETADLVKYITEIKDSKQAYLLFSRYMEALVAYHRFHDGRD